MRQPATQSKPALARTTDSAKAGPRFPAWLMAVSLGLLTIALYWPVTGYEFINFDDPDYAAANPHVQQGLTWESIDWAFETRDIGLWHPLTWISHMLDCQWFGLHSGGHHLTSMLLHAANTVLLWLVLRGMTGALWRSAMVAALFALHPLHVESVAWVAERKDVLSTFWVLLTLLAYHYYTEVQRQGPECGMQPPAKSNTQQATLDTHHASRFTPHVSLFYVLSLFFFLFGLMSKPMIVTLPLLLLLLDYWPLRRIELAALVSRPRLALGLVVEKLPFLTLAALIAWDTRRSAKGVGSLWSADRYPMPARFANATQSCARYLWEVFWPGDLTVFYPFPASFSVGAVAGAALVLVAISLAAVWLAQRRPYLLVGWLWYVVTLLPVSGFVQLAGYSHADRYTYVPLVGVFITLTWAGADLASRWPRPVKTWTGAVIATALLLCLVCARQQVGYWKDSETLFGHALKVSPDNWLAHLNLGEALDAKGQTDEAMRHYAEAVRLNPDHPNAHNNLGATLDDKGQTDAAILQFQDAIHLKPDHVQAHNNLGIALGRKGQTDEAIREFQEAIRLKPDYAEAHYNLGLARASKGQTDEAIRQFQETLRLKPDYAAARQNLDAVLAAQSSPALPPTAEPKNGSSNHEIHQTHER
jgi:Flp pilus assembly protein TadD